MSALNMLRKPFRYSFFNATIGLIVINVILYLVTILNQSTSGLNSIVRLLATPGPRSNIYFWQPLTYMFMHGSFTHILFNMFVLFMFGIPLERRLGSSEFLAYYLFSGIATGIVLLLLRLPTVGASAAIYGVLLGFAIFYPDTTILVFFVIPMRAKFAVLVFTGLSLVLNFVDRSSNISHIGHLMGVFFAGIYLFIRLGINPVRELFRR